MSNPVSIIAASEGVCFLCGADGPVFEAATPCGRLSGLPVCAKDLFAVVVARQRAGGAEARGRGKPAAKSRSADATSPAASPADHSAASAA